MPRRRAGVGCRCLNQTGLRYYEGRGGPQDDKMAVQYGGARPAGGC
ncbi:MAG: hypothetical protein ACYYK0_01665 [Candidatus Eutrophobiaceae bacterium]